MAQTAHDQTARVPERGFASPPARRPAAAVRLTSPSQPQHRPGYARVSPAVATSGHASGQLTQRAHFWREGYNTVQCPHCCRGTPVGEFRRAAASPLSGKLVVATAPRSLHQDWRFRDHASSWRRVPRVQGYKAGNFRTSCSSSPVGGCAPDRHDQRSRKAGRAPLHPRAAFPSPPVNGAKPLAMVW